MLPNHSICACGFPTPRECSEATTLPTCPSCGEARSSLLDVQVGDFVDEGVVVEIDGDVAYVEGRDGEVRELR